MIPDSSSSSDSLAPLPLPNRHRASSTNVRPALTIQTLESRKRSSSLLILPPPAPTPPVELKTNPLEFSADSLQSPSIFAVFASRALQFLRLHSQHEHTILESIPLSPGSSADEPLLPLSSSPSRASFGDVSNEKGSPLRSEVSWSASYSVHTPILLVIILFPVSTALVLFCFWTLPITGSWPGTLSELAQMGRELHAYSQSGSGPMAHVIGVVSVTVVWNHAWSIPGSVLWNVLAGALFSPILATILLTTLTTLGSIMATLLSTPLAPILTHFFPRALDLTRTTLEGSSSPNLSSEKPQDTSLSSSSPAWVRLSVLRLVGIIPWSGINIACGIAGVPLSQCILGSFIGCLPWTAVTCQLGDILQTMSGVGEAIGVGEMLARPEMVARLIFLTALAGAPILARDKLKSLVEGVEGDVEGERGRWQWVKEWRKRLASRSREGERRVMESELRVLVDEKRARDDENWA